MSRRPNLLRIDDVLLHTGWIAMFAWLAGALVATVLVLNDQLGPGTAIGAGLITASAPIALLVAGSNLRRREKRAWGLHKLIDEHVEVSADDLLRSTDFTPGTLDRAIRDLNNVGAAFFVWDRKSGRIVDGRLRTARSTIDECGSCGAKVQIDVRLDDLATARCPYCHDPIGAESALEQKAELMEKLGAHRTSTRTRATAASSPFSIPVFVILLFVFWPLAIGYAFLKWKNGVIQL
jgi:hypothetical protein